MAYGRGGHSPVAGAFTLSPLPYPVLFILFVVFIFLGISWSFTYEEAIEDAEQNINWVLMAAPILLLIAVRWLSSVEDFGPFFGRSTAARLYYGPSEGSSPWAPAALIILLLFLVSHQSTFHGMWFH